VFSCDFNIKMLLFELDFEEFSKKKLRECWSKLCRIRCKSGWQAAPLLATAACHRTNDINSPLIVIEYQPTKSTAVLWGLYRL